MAGVDIFMSPVYTLPMKRTTIRLPDDLLKRAKTKASKDGRTLTSLVTEGLRLVLSNRPTSCSRTVTLPLSSQRGGLRDGIDINRSADLLDILDGR